LLRGVLLTFVNVLTTRTRASSIADGQFVYQAAQSKITRAETFVSFSRKGTGPVKLNSSSLAGRQQETAMRRLDKVVKAGVGSTLKASLAVSNFPRTDLSAMTKPSWKTDSFHPSQS
jgi:hypothetical protein